MRKPPSSKAKKNLSLIPAIFVLGICVFAILKMAEQQKKVSALPPTPAPESLALKSTNDVEVPVPQKKKHLSLPTRDGTQK